MTYDYIRSNYIKNKIRGKSFSDEKFKRYIKDLIMIERYVAGERIGWISAMWVCNVIRGRIFRKDGRDVFIDLSQNKSTKGSIKIDYKKEYETIRDELDPDWREEQAERERKQAEKNAREEQKKMKEREKDLKEWVKLGGLP